MRVVLCTFLALLALLACPSDAHAARVAGSSVRHAQQVWAPFNSGTPVCSTGLRIYYFKGNPRSKIIAWSRMGGGCVVHLSSYLGEYGTAYQCLIIAHELGHSVFGLDHVDDPNSLMFKYPENPPLGC